jgi:hypothetical protein
MNSHSTRFVAAKSGPRRAKPGPKIDTEGALRVAHIINSIVTIDRWRANLETICDALDADGIPRPKTWRKRGLRSWCDAFDKERPIVTKALQYRLLIAKRETLG